METTRTPLAAHSDSTIAVYMDTFIQALQTRALPQPGFSFHCTIEFLLPLNGTAGEGSCETIMTFGGSEAVKVQRWLERAVEHGSICSEQCTDEGKAVTAYYLETKAVAAVAT